MNQRRQCIKIGAGIAIMPTSLLYASVAHAIWPGLIARLLIRQGLRSGLRQLAKPVVKSRKQSISVFSSGAFSYASETLAAEVALQVLINAGDSVFVEPSVRTDAEHTYPIWNGVEKQSIFLEVPAVHQTISDNLSWATYNLHTGELVKLGQYPVTFLPSAEPMTVELVIPPLAQRGLHAFVATLENHSDELPVLRSDIVDIVQRGRL